MISTSLLNRFRWINFPGGILVLLLQRTPVLRLLVSSESCLMAPSASVLRSLLLPATALGAVHALAGATVIATSPTSPANATVGKQFNMALSPVGGGASTANSWAVQNSLPPGLTVKGGSVQGNQITVSFTSDDFLTISGTPTTAGTYTFDITAWEFGSFTGPSTFGTITIKVAGGTAPIILDQPIGVSANSGGTVALTAFASGTPAPSYQWMKGSVPIVGATNATLMLSNVQPSDAGAYSVVASNSAGNVTSNSANLTVTSGQLSRISNMSVRTNLGSGQTLIVGFVTTGAKNLLVRAVGPGLGTTFNLPGFYPTPKIAIVNQSGITVAQNSAWDSSLASTFASLGAFSLTPGSADAALLQSINGPNTVQVNGGSSGVMLVEVYDADDPASANRLTNVSARNQVGTGSNVLIAGFVVAGNAARTLLIRGIGPALNVNFGVTGQLADPRLDVFTSSGSKIVENDDWDRSLIPTFNTVGAYQFTKDGSASKDAAILVTLPPGAYTAQVSGIGGGTGDSVIEVYVVP